MQCTIKYNKETKKWEISERHRIPIKSVQIFKRILNRYNKKKLIFKGKIPPFINRQITHSKWLEIKRSSNDFKDTYIDCKEDTIRELYREKGCKYIQISEKGLYHLGDDICKFGVPIYKCKQDVRIRTKIHKRCDKNGYCTLSVMLAAKPKNINNVEKSAFSLDDICRLPKNLILLKMKDNNFG